MQTCKQKIKDQDQFGESFRMNLDADEHYLKSYGGCICSLLALCIIALYAYLKMDVLIYNKDRDVVSVMHEMHFDDDF